MKNLNWVLASLLILVAIGVSSFVVYTTTIRTLTTVESILWQVFVLTAGLAGSFIFGRQSATESAREMIRPHARSAFRRLRALYENLSHAANVIELGQEPASQENFQITLARLEEIVATQLIIADDALEDWNDVIPEEVEELKQKLHLTTRRRNPND